MCLGAQARAANESAKRQYNYEIERRERNWMQEIAIYNAQKVKYQTDSDNIAIAQSQAYAKKQEDMNIARGAAQLKYEDLYRKVLQDNEASNLIASGATGRSVNRLKTMEYADYGRQVNAIGRKIMMDDVQLERKTSKEVSLPYLASSIVFILRTD